MTKNLSGESTLDKKYWLARIEEMAGQGQRVLIIAVKAVEHQ